MNQYLDIHPEVAEALRTGKPVVALESTIISHGMPYPQNVQTALQVEAIIRENGAVPATIAIIGDDSILRIHAPWVHAPHTIALVPLRQRHSLWQQPHYVRVNGTGILGYQRKRGIILGLVHKTPHTPHKFIGSNHSQLGNEIPFSCATALMALLFCNCANWQL